MQPKRSKLFPIGNTFSNVGDGRLKEVFQSSPQTLHHFTRFDQVDQLVGASEADPDLGFMVRLLALCSLPRTNPGNRKEYKRVNGPYTLYMIAGGGNKLPFGNLPRLLLAWICTEAVRTQSRELVLGRSLSEFMRRLNILSSDSGGVTGVRTRGPHPDGSTLSRSNFTRLRGRARQREFQFPCSGSRRALVGPEAPRRADAVGKQD